VIMRGILEEQPAPALRRFVELAGLLLDIDKAQIEAVASSTIRYLHASKEERQQLRLNQELEQRWYASLAAGAPDYAVYDSDLYLADLWACWIVYSRRYLLGLRTATVEEHGALRAHIGALRSIVDLGCGFGYTTAALAGMYPDATITGTNLEDIKQTRLALLLGKHYRFAVVPRIDAIPAPVDLIFASEYFEHLPAPVDHLRDVLERLEPRALLIANTFGARSIGHFDRYCVAGQQLDGRATARAFSGLLRQSGYRQIETSLWNSRPAYWRRD
jgi:SAM-dependent methyltransferase